MLSPAVALDAIDPAHWTRGYHLLAPPALAADFGWALAVIVDQRIVKIAILGGESVDVPEPRPATQQQLAALRRELGVRALIAVDGQVLTEALARAERAISLDDDYVSQWLGVWRELRASGALAMDPPLLKFAPAPPAAAIQTAFDLAIPDRSTVVAYVFDDRDRDLITSVIASKRGGQWVRVTTHRAIAHQLSSRTVAQSWRKNRKPLLSAVDREIDRPSIGLFATESAVRRCLRGSVDQVGKEIGRGELIVDPAPVWLRPLISGAGLVGKAGGAAALSRLIPRSAKRAGADVVRQARQVAGKMGVDPFAHLGFDPLELWDAWRQFLFADPS